MKRPKIIIVSFSTFCKHFTEHRSTLEEFADITRLDVAADFSRPAGGSSKATRRKGPKGQ